MATPADFGLCININNMRVRPVDIYLCMKVGSLLHYLISLIFKIYAQHYYYVHKRY